jgi:hypothetical protein
MSNILKSDVIIKSGKFYGLRFEMINIFHIKKIIRTKKTKNGFLNLKHPWLVYKK